MSKICQKNNKKVIYCEMLSFTVGMTLQYDKKCKKHAFEQRLERLEIETVFITDIWIFNLLEYHVVGERVMKESAN